MLKNGSIYFLPHDTTGDASNWFRHTAWSATVPPAFVVTAVLTFVGADYFSNGTTLSFSGQTTVKRSGALLAYALDVPPDSAGTTKDVGKFTGLKSKGTYANLLNSGTFKDTFVG